MLSRRARAATPTCPTHPPHRSPPPAMARLFAGRIGGVSSRPGTPTPAQPYGSDSLSKNRPGALTQVSGWSPFVSRRPEW
ncbi:MULTISPECIES: hypothetical protein [Gammaproteobacteria]|uniref:Uncharacterized protein n=6 Tax=Enterobacteriaceae TaxID=543 RepID=A0A223LKH7_ECOLX|nr:MULTISPECIES: hypothetical protein [Gammaproteobacteria]AET87447.1 hypothetical protein [uncultured bacterium]APB01969.1 Hypothetical protein [Shigella boydii]API82618.1 Hypothetical protein [Leclercia adecarboxylata]ARD68237.1 Hypothetical protein [Klebsiella pneumoniae]ARD69095.1 Hypothetical protein [Enterobacter cloacae]ASU04514.1 Hypothetical protein [Escherichia coli]AVA18671.1 Hypothetical protein [Citrobacter freundii]EMD1719469.1 hypothetical protein [Providencia stuartii]UUW41